jgi:hypothetical protein
MFVCLLLLVLLGAAAWLVCDMVSGLQEGAAVLR